VIDAPVYDPIMVIENVLIVETFNVFKVIDDWFANEILVSNESMDELPVVIGLGTTPIVSAL